MPAPVEYRVEIHDAHAHLFRVCLKLAEPRAEGESFSLPVWIPGSYMIREFAKNIIEIKASQGGRPVRLEKQDKHSWRTARLKPALPLEVETLVYAWDLSVRCAHLDASHGFFNGTQLFLCVAGREHQSHRVEIQRPETPGLSRWQLATTLPAAGRRSVDKTGFGAFEAADYDSLIDHPVEMGEFQRVHFTAAGVPHEMVVTGRVRFDAQRLAADLQRACEAVIAFFGETPPPFQRYLFLTMVVGDGYGGLEHRDSTALLCSRNDLPVPSDTGTSEAYRGFLGLCSHEYFHAWNVKRIKPAAFLPYRLDVENHTSLLWVFEGFTSYYDDLALRRAGLIKPQEYLALLAKTITAVERNPGRLRQSVAESSFDAWTKYYRQDENSPNAIVSYYQKGSLVALGLDLTLRARSEGKKSLDDVMRLLWREYGQTAQGVGEEEMAAIILRATGIEVRRELARWVDGCEDVPLVRLLRPFGVQLTYKAGARLTGLGLRTRAEGNVVRIANVIEGGSAQVGGLSAGDKLVALNGLRVTAGNLDSLLARCQPGESLQFVAFRRDELLQLQVALRAPAQEECMLTPLERPAPAARKLLKGWLGG
ncbi:MAG: peptidase M61 [Candidatus Dactylopiibacterium carminicum]|uniref:Peptidase M61 n=1 Tax=Candidatus Dactylopiibacterium carminicum TaxID=857335 RepID=A0A272ENR6_9RHOO|nr:PDZ domain-containing protein [Candidatus Dactylopiibacterium carminicum]KAF7598125.1 peptidase M61 [Candidatus Dactylopiibacterium carminicum]PAS91749.1 MAG: peptidase M61 [Candidatus Dactylopiibacterium carminicum]PAS96686.1 MAG: peptidase M61 [Candidatus Dactylopiibacterium carminicum]